MNLKDTSRTRMLGRFGTAFALASLLGLSTALLEPAPAHALGWSDITGAAKKVGGAVKKAGKRAGSGFKGLASGAAKGAGKVAKEAGALGYEAAKGAVNTGQKAAVSALTDMVVRPTGKTLVHSYGYVAGKDKAEMQAIHEDAIREMHETFRQGTDGLGRGVGYVKDKIKNNTGRGTLTSRNRRSETAGSSRSHLTKSRRGQTRRGRVVQGGNRKLPRARSPYPASIDPRRNARQQNAPDTVATKVGTTRKAGKTVSRRSTHKPGQWGSNRPTTSKLPPARNAGRKLPPPRKQRPRPITSNDVKPPFCNSKFESCSGKHKHKHNGKKYNGRDRSVWGRPVLTSRKKSSGTVARDKSVFGRPLGAKKSRQVTKDIKIKRTKRGYRKLTRDRKIQRDRRKLSRDRNLKRNKRFTRDRKVNRKRMNRNSRFKRNNRKRFSRQLRRNNRSNRGFKLRRNNRGGFRNRRNRQRR